PTEHPGLEEGPVDDQLPTALEQVAQAHLTLGSIKRVRLLHGHPRHPSTLGSERVAGAGQRLFLHEHVLARTFPFLRRNNRWRVLPVLLAFRPASWPSPDRYVRRSSGGSDKCGAIPFERCIQADEHPRICEARRLSSSEYRQLVRARRSRRGAFSIALSDRSL